MPFKMTANLSCHLDSPESLESLCLNYICENLAKISVIVPSVVDIHTTEVYPEFPVDLSN